MLQVLIVDDEPKICSLILQLGNWEQLGLKVVAVCHDGEEALDKIQTLEPDIVITDIRMPVFDGLELVSRSHDLGLNISFIIISGYRNFEYAYNALQSGVMNYLLKPINQEQLNATLEKAITSIEKRHMDESNELRLAHFQKEQRISQEYAFVTALAKGSVGGLSEDEFASGEGLFGVCIVNPSFAVLHERGSIFGSMVIECAEKIFQPLGKMIAVSYPNGINCLFHFAKDRLDEIENGISTLFGEVRSLADIFGDFKLSFGVSSFVPDIGQLAAAYSQAVRNERRKLKIGWNRIISSEESEKVYSEDPNTIDRECQPLFSALETLNRETADAWFQNLHQTAEAGEDWNLDRLFLIRDVLLQQYAQMKDTPSVDALRMQTQLTDSPEKFISLLSQAFVDILEERREKLFNEDTRPIRMAKEYIHQNYAKNLSLDMVAAEVGYSSVYFSTMFKKNTGESFMDYVIQVRIEKAKELLKTTDLNISEIAGSIGYQDDKYFRKLFHKIVGITPKAYRRLYE